MTSHLPEEFLRGVELFNAEKFFECHESWEVIWLKSEDQQREFLHAMIQAAAALLHLQRGNLQGARSVGERAIGKLEQLPATMMSVETTAFRQALTQSLTRVGVPPPTIRLTPNKDGGEVIQVNSGEKQ